MSSWWVNARKGLKGLLRGALRSHEGRATGRHRRVTVESSVEDIVRREGGILTLGARSEKGFI